MNATAHDVDAWPFAPDGWLYPAGPDALLAEVQEWFPRASVAWGVFPATIKVRAPKWSATFDVETGEWRGTARFRKAKSPLLIRACRSADDDASRFRWLVDHPHGPSLFAIARARLLCGVLRAVCPDVALRINRDGAGVEVVVQHPYGRTLRMYGGGDGMWHAEFEGDAPERPSETWGMGRVSELFDAWMRSRTGRVV